MQDTLGDRIKRYEAVSNYRLTPRSPVIVRVDGKAFHGYTRGLDKPFDRNFVGAMVDAARQTAAQMMGFKLAYVQSDEATFLLTDYDRHETEGWFNYELSKILSVTTSIYTICFNDLMRAHGVTKQAVFDARAFVVPEDDVPNVFLWRQKDWVRNSLYMLCRSLMTHRELMHKGRAEMHELLHQRGVNWADLDDQLKNGTYVDRGRGTICSVQPIYEAIAELVRTQLGE